MARMVKGVLRIATLLIGMSATSVALAVATLEVTTTGPKAEQTVIQLFDSNDKEVPPTVMQAAGPTYTNLSGTYHAQVLVGGQKKGAPTTITLADGKYQLLVDSDTGTATIIPPVATAPQAGGPMLFPALFPGVQLGGFGATVGPGVVTDKPPTIGVFPTTDTSLLTGPSRVTTIGERIFLNFLSGGELGCDWVLGYQQGDRSTSAGVSPGTESGWAFWTPASSGSTGVSSAGGANASLKTTYSAFNLDVGLPSWPKKDPSSSYWGVPMLGYQYSETKYNGTISNASVPGVSSTTNQKVKENDLRVGYGVRGMYTASNQIWVSGTVGLDAIYYWGNYNGTQDNECAPCAPSTQSFTVSNSNSKSGLTFGAWADAAVGFPVSKDVDLFLLGTYRYDHAATTLVNNVTPADPAPHLSTGDRNWASIEFGVRVKFNAP